MNYRKTLAVLTALAACASVTAMPAGVQDKTITVFAEEAAEAAKLEEGSLGDKVTFTIYDNGEMIITGSGAITKTTEDLENRNTVTSIVFKDDAEGGVTEICEAAFCRMEKLENVTLPKSLKTIENIAFAGCVKLSDITIPAGIETIDEYTFAGCEKLSEVSVPEGVKTIGAQAFAYCYGITDIYIPDSVKKIDEKVFEEDRIKDIWFGGSEDDWKAAIGEYADSEDLKKVSVHFNAVSLKYTMEEAEKLRECGDVDANGKADITDLTLISLYNIGDRDFSKAELIFADLDKDGKVTLADLATLRMVLSHKITLE